MSANSSACAGDDDEFVVELGSEVGGMDCLVDFGVERWLDHWLQGFGGMEFCYSYRGSCQWGCGVVDQFFGTSSAPEIRYGSAISIS